VATGGQLDIPEGAVTCVSLTGTNLTAITGGRVSALLDPTALSSATVASASATSALLDVVMPVPAGASAEHELVVVAGAATLARRGVRLLPLTVAAGGTHDPASTRGTPSHPFGSLVPAVREARAGGSISVTGTVLWRAGTNAENATLAQGVRILGANGSTIVSGGSNGPAGTLTLSGNLLRGIIFADFQNPGTTPILHAQPAMGASPGQASVTLSNVALRSSNAGLEVLDGAVVDLESTVPGACNLVNLRQYGVRVNGGELNVTGCVFANVQHTAIILEGDTSASVMGSSFTLNGDRTVNADAAHISLEGPVNLDVASSEFSGGDGSAVIVGNNATLNFAGGNLMNDVGEPGGSCAGIWQRGTGTAVVLGKLPTGNTFSNMACPGYYRDGAGTLVADDATFTNTNLMLLGSGTATLRRTQISNPQGAASPLSGFVASCVQTCDVDVEGISVNGGVNGLDLGSNVRINLRAVPNTAGNGRDSCSTTNAHNSGMYVHDGAQVLQAASCVAGANGLAGVAVSNATFNGGPIFVMENNGQRDDATFNDGLVAQAGATVSIVNPRLRCNSMLFPENPGTQMPAHRGIRVQTGGSVTLQGGYLEGCLQGVRVEGGTVSISQTTLDGHDSAVHASGGNTTLRGVKARYNLHSALRADGNSTVATDIETLPGGGVVPIEFDQNRQWGAHITGGATVTMANTSVTRNSSQGIYVNGTSAVQPTVSVTGTLVQSNGAGLYMTGRVDTFTVTGTQFSNNEYEGVRVDDEATLAMTDCVFNNNGTVGTTSAYLSDFRTTAEAEPITCERCSFAGVSIPFNINGYRCGGPQGPGGGTGSPNCPRNGPNVTANGNTRRAWRLAGPSAGFFFSN
jgi:hypothetical protein